MYGALLGKAWSELPHVVRAVHQPGEISGNLDVSWGSGWLARIAARWLGFPRPGRATPVVLSIQGQGKGSQWRRRIGGALLVTEQHVVEGLVLEALGRVVCAFRVEADSRGLWYTQEFAALRIGQRLLKLPSWLAPRVMARVTQVGEHAHTEVHIHAPALGLILRYDGLVAPSSVPGEGS